MENGKANTLDPDSLAELTNALRASSGMSRSPPLVLTGTGHMFSAGVDLYRLLEGGRRLYRAVPAADGAVLHGTVHVPAACRRGHQRPCDCRRLYHRLLLRPAGSWLTARAASASRNSRSACRSLRCRSRSCGLRRPRTCCRSSCFSRRPTAERGAREGIWSRRSCPPPR